jgi:hypothetical protein
MSEGEMKREIDRLYQYRRASDRIILRALDTLKQAEQAEAIKPEWAHAIRLVLTEPLPIIEEEVEE